MQTSYRDCGKRRGDERPMMRVREQALEHPPRTSRKMRYRFPIMRRAREAGGESPCKVVAIPGGTQPVPPAGDQIGIPAISHRRCQAAVRLRFRALASMLYTMSGRIHRRPFRSTRWRSM
jgi:hypothetical protein